jgi:hypothetical protein
LHQFEHTQKNEVCVGGIWTRCEVQLHLLVTRLVQAHGELTTRAHGQECEDAQVH